MINIDIQKPLYGSSGEMLLDFKLEIKNGDFLALIGKSGSGKTTLLRILAGLEEAKGKIEVDNIIWQNDKTILPPQKREIGFVFQDYALFSNMSVEQNLVYVNNDKKLVDKLLEITELKDLKNRFPHTLSGGQKQRVSLCRAMMNKPKLLLMDEPLSALDPNMRTKLQNEILTLHKEFKTTTIMVSHDPSEIYRLATNVVEIEQGKIINQGKAKDILLKTNGSSKFSFQGELLDIIKADVINIAIVSIGQQIVQVVITNSQAKELKIGEKINISTKAFAPIIT